METKRIVLTLTHSAYFGHGWEGTGLTYDDLVRADATYAQQLLEENFPDCQILVAYDGILSRSVTVIDDGEEDVDFAVEVDAFLDSAVDIGELPLRTVYALAGRNPEEAPFE